MIEVDIPIRFADVDAAEIVYYPRYFHFFHVGMEEFFARVVGEHYSRFVSDRRRGLPTVRVETDFRSPLRYGETLRLEVSIEQVGETSVHWCFDGTEAESKRDVVRARVVTVYSDLERLRKLSVPPELRERLVPTRSGS